MIGDQQGGGKMSRSAYSRLIVSGDKVQLTAFSVEVSAAIENAADKQCSQAWYGEAGLLDALYDSETEELDGSSCINWMTDRKTPKFDLERVSKVFQNLLFEFVYMDEGPDYAGAEACINGSCVTKIHVPLEEMHYYYAIPDAKNGLDEEDDQVVIFDDLVVALLKRLRKTKRVLDVASSLSAPKEALLSKVPARQARLRKKLFAFVSDSSRNKPKTLATDLGLCELIRAFHNHFEDRLVVSFDIIPEEFLSDLVAIQLCLTNSSNWKALPKRFLTQRFFDKYIRASDKISVTCRSELRLVPKKFRSSSIMRYACKKNVDGLEQVSKKDRTRELCKLGVSRYGRNLSLVPMEYRDSLLCCMAVKKDGVALQYVPKPLRTLDLCKIAVAENSSARIYVPKVILKDLDAIRK